MKILAVEFSSAQRSVAVWEAGGSAASPALLGSALQPPLPRLVNSQFTIQNPPFSSQRSLGLVEEALAGANCRREEIGDQAVALSGVPGAAGVSRLMAMAHWVQEKKQAVGRR